MNTIFSLHVQSFKMIKKPLNSLLFKLKYYLYQLSKQYTRETTSANYSNFMDFSLPICVPCRRVNYFLSLIKNIAINIEEIVNSFNYILASLEKER